MANNLPTGDSTTLALVHPTPSEQDQQTLNNSDEWRGALPLDAYIRREALLANQQLTKDGGITFWVLVDTAENPPEGADRTIIAGCETLQKRALLAQNGTVTDALCHGVASVFSPAKYRGRGYGARMIAELGKHLRTWQQKQGRPQLSILFSDIGKKFYAKHGWHPYPSSHMHLPPLSGDMKVTVRLPASTPLTGSALAPLCALDEELLRQKLAIAAQEGYADAKPIMAIIPDAATIAWHLAREDFVAKELFGTTPPIKGAQVTIPCPATPMGKRRAWGVWTRLWYNEDTAVSKGNTLHLLRICVEPAPQGYDRESSFVEDTQAVMAILEQAQRQAGEWKVAEVEVWNPIPATRQAVKLLAQDYATQGGAGEWGTLVDRDSESICSLKWYGEGGTPGAEVEWIECEKFGWC